MKAIRIHQFGPTEDVLQYEDVPVPEPKAGEVLIKVAAASLNRADLGLRKGTYRISADALPLIPGREFAGTVEKLGAGVNEYHLGQRVVAYPVSAVTLNTPSQKFPKFGPSPMELRRFRPQQCQPSFSPPGSAC
jgi:NADPH:quinone reductase-like Zn-dependent oxidoreductase